MFLKYDFVEGIFPTSFITRTTHLLDEYSDKGKGKSTQLVPNWGRLFSFQYL
jgi:hypothetical protein